MAKTTTPFHSLTASGILGGVLAAVRAPGRPTTIRRAPTSTKAPSLTQLAIRNAHAFTLAALRFASKNTTPPSPYAENNVAAWRSLTTASNMWHNAAQRRFAAFAFTGNTPDFPIWNALPADTRAAWDAAAAHNTPSLPPVIQTPAPPAIPYSLPSGRALLAHELSRPTVPGQNPPSADYPPIYGEPSTAYTRAFWDFARLAWDAGAALWDYTTPAVWDATPLIDWDANLTPWDAR
jgi:hypothetical protein